ncbi:MAG: (d)CMP kinase [Chlamydiales bacterium]|nr:(d)CMP kinase [Chlamydiia bacterium]MCP5508529.1 (d)CMP kinase [Chlamydiales bacterium]
MIITIDGPIATGKSSIAKKLAEQIGFIYFDTGAMYRSLTWGILNEGIDPDDKQAIIDYLERFHYNIKVKHGEKHYFVGDSDVTAAIRGPEVTQAVSQVSAVKEVREKLLEVQRRLAYNVNAVFEGRDMGSVVFPDADIKIFLTGRPEVRAKRRFDELVAKYPDQYRDLTLEQTLEDINRRDHYDSSRDVSPLIQPEDAFVIDTSDLAIGEIVLRIQEYRDAHDIQREEKSPKLEG